MNAMLAEALNRTLLLMRDEIVADIEREEVGLHLHEAVGFGRDPQVVVAPVPCPVYAE